MTTYTYKIIAPPGSLSSTAEGINDLGQVVGEFTDSSGEHGFLYSNGIYTIVVPPVGTGAHLSDINNSGQITGWYGGSPNGQGIGFLYTDGVFTTINPPGSFSTQPISVNDSGQVVGYYFDSIGEHGFLYSAGTYTTLDLPTGNGYFTVALDINNSGQIVGTGFGSDAQHGFLYSAGVYTMIDPPGTAPGAGASAIAINDSAQIVGNYGDSSNHYHSFLYSGGSYTILDFPGSVNTGVSDASGINDSGQVVGGYQVSSDGHSITGGYGFVYSGGTFTTIGPNSLSGANNINASGQIIGNGLAGFVGSEPAGFGFLAVALPLPVMLNAISAKNLTTLSGTAEANSSVSVFDGANLIGIVSAAADGTWSLQANVKGNAVHSFTETSTDLAGNVASSAGVTLYTPAANKVLTGGNGDDVLIGGPNDTLTGGLGADTLVFNPSFGKETVTDYKVNQDVLAFSHALFTIDTASQVLSQAHDSKAGAVIVVDPGDTITLLGVTVAQLQAAQQAHVDWLHFF